MSCSTPRLHLRIAGLLALVTCMLVCVLVRPAGPAWGTAAEPDCVAGPDCTSEATIDARQSSAEQQLAEKYAPILQLKEQSAPCDTDGEAYEPSPVEIVFDNPRVMLVVPEQGAGRSLVAPAAEDLVDNRSNRDAYLDFPGTPGRPGCTYEQDFRAFSADAPVVAYARLQREGDKLALQYWFYYYFNDWNNRHESDWEMIQLLFQADSAAEALEQEPVQVGYSQHGGGEKADWNGSKLQREDTHVIVYPSAGSHANYYARPSILASTRAPDSGAMTPPVPPVVCQPMRASFPMTPPA